MSDTVWSKRKAILMVSDDWGMCAWCPTAQVYEELHPLEFMRTPWSAGTLETPADMERLFTLLEEFRGGDGLPAMIQPFYVVGNPDYDAIVANGFTTYVDIGIDRGVSPGWQRGNLTAKAREGMVRGVWHPGYHGRAHHFSPSRWIARLRERDEWAILAFKRHVYVCETVPDRLPEFAGMEEPAQVAWVSEGLLRFERAFGYPARGARNSDFTELVLRVLADRGVRAVTDEGPLKRSDDALTVLPHLIDFEPFLTADHEDVVARAFAAIESAWASGRLAAVSSHRRNYKGFDQGDVERNFACLRALLARVATAHPDAIYLCADEVAQMERYRYSVVRRGDRVICRNYSDLRVSIHLPIGGAEYNMTLPCGEVLVQLDPGA